MREKILNLTQHKATEEQIKAGVFDITKEKQREMMLKELTFEKIPTKEEIENRAYILMAIAKIICSREKCKKVMIGGAPYLMAELEEVLRLNKLIPVYAFSKRISKEIKQEDGSIKKISVFKFGGFVEKR